MTGSVPSPNPLDIRSSSAGTETVQPGMDFSVGITLHNQGTRDVVLTARLEAERSPLLTQWCQSSQQRIALGTGQSGEVDFLLTIPGEALPGVWEYDLVVQVDDDGDSTTDDTTIPPWREKHYLQVLAIPPSQQQHYAANTPTFSLTPLTSPQAPQSIRPGVPIPLDLWVENRSDRVDRFRLTALGLPSDWQTTITYPRETSGPGLMVEAHSLGLNPGDRGQILVMLTPPQDALAGSYVPTLRLRSQNQPDLNLLELVYIQVEPVYFLQPTLHILRSQVRKDPALFEVQLSNTGNTPRTVHLEVENLDEAGSCQYIVDPAGEKRRRAALAQHPERLLAEDLGEMPPPPKDVTIVPKGSQRIRLEALPQHWWKRPLFGGGRSFNFRVTVTDPEDHPIAIETVQGNLTWLARPWWQFLGLIVMGVGAIATLAFLIWWVFFRTPPMPRILAIEPQDSRYSAAHDSARVNWQIEHPDRVQALKLTGLGPEGTILSGPQIYDLSKALPSALQSACTLQDELLWCKNVNTGARDAGTYQFELEVVPKGKVPKAPIVEQTKAIVVDPKPAPQVRAFFPNELIYLEPGGKVVPEIEPSTIPTITRKGIELSWVINHPEDIETLKLVGRDGDGKVVGTHWYPVQAEGRVPTELQQWCRWGETLFCERVSLSIYEVGEYQFELTVIPKGLVETEVEPVVTEVVTIQPQSSQILSFQVNGAEVQPKYLIPLGPNPSSLVLDLSWEIAGGETTTAMLSPVPGDVGLMDSATVPLPPEPGSTTYTLQVSDASGASFTRSFTVELYDPNPSNPSEVVADAIKEAVQELTAEDTQDDIVIPPASGDAADVPLGTPGAAEPDVVSPIERPPQFDQ